MRSIAVRFGQTLFVLWAVATLLFLMFRLMPGDPTLAYIDTTFTAEQQEALRRQFGLDQPLLEQYLIYLAQPAAAANSARRSHEGRPVFESSSRSLPNTLALTALSSSSPTSSACSPAPSWPGSAASVTEGIAIPVVLARAPRRSSGSAWSCWRSSPSASAGSRRAAPIAPARSIPATSQR